MPKNAWNEITNVSMFLLQVNAEVHNVQQREQAEISSLRKLLAERDERLRQLEENVELLVISLMLSAIWSIGP